MLLPVPSEKCTQTKRTMGGCLVLNGNGDAIRCVTLTVDGCKSFSQPSWACKEINDTK